MKKSLFLPVFALIAVLSIGGLFLLQVKFPGNQITALSDQTFPGIDATTTAVTLPTTDADATTTVDIPAGTKDMVAARMKHYENLQYHFSLTYPENLLMHTGGGGDALTVAFEDPETREGFQVFATSYTEPSVSKDRFKLDEPSGVYLEPTDILVDHERATMFFSKNTIMGETREVWFIHGGYLYEVTTYKELDTWLAGIMRTWKFL